MNCLESQDLLQRRLDGDTCPASLALDQHLAGCPSCRHKHAAGMLMLDGLKALPRCPELRTGFAQQLVGRILHDRQKRRVRMRRQMWVTAGLAAAILIMVLAGNFWLPKPNVPKEPAPVVQKNKEPEHPTPLPAPRNPAEQKPEAKAAALAQSMEEAGNDAAQSLRQAGQGMSEGLNTVSRNAQRAVSFFMNELPVLDSMN